jgi:hypothetical protein
MSVLGLADVCDARLGLHLFSGRRNGWQLQHGRFLALAQLGQEDGLAVRELQRIVVAVRDVFVNLAEDRGLVDGGLGTPAEQAVGNAGDLLGEREFSARKDANRGRGIFRCRKPAGSSTGSSTCHQR